MILAAPFPLKMFTVAFVVAFLQPNPDGIGFKWQRRLSEAIGIALWSLPLTYAVLAAEINIYWAVVGACFIGRFSDAYIRSLISYVFKTVVNYLFKHKR